MPTFRMLKPDERKTVKAMIEQLISLNLKELDRIERFRAPHLHYIEELKLFLKNQRGIDQLFKLIGNHRTFLQTTWELSLQTVKELPCFSCQHPCDQFQYWRRKHLALVEKYEEEPMK